MIARRTLARVLVLSIVALPVATVAQQPAGKTARIGYLAFLSGPSYLDEAFRQGLRELGYVEGQNIAIEYRWADFKPDQASTLAAELVRLKVDIIVSTGGLVPALAAKKASTTMPIVFIAGQPVKAGLVASFGRPGGNVTGISILSSELNAKRLELLKRTVPGVPASLAWRFSRIRRIPRPRVI